jgi:hypothetical protein
MSSPLLSLPGELKNMIFKLALSESDGVDFVEDESGNGWLCLHARDRDVTSSIVIHDTAMYTVKGGRVIANQLQFVCRQLCRETKTLGILYNTIAFIGPYIDTSIILTFVDGLPTRLQHQPHNFILKESPLKKRKKHLCGLRALFNKYPQCTLKYHHPNVVSTAMLLNALWIKHGVRQDFSFVKRLSNNEYVQHRLLMLFDMEAKMKKVWWNFRYLTIFPYEDVLDEDAFRAACSENRFIQERLIPTLKNGVDDLVAVARELHANGL